MIGKELDLPRKAFCIHCHKYRKVFYGRRVECVIYRDAHLEYEEIIGFCSRCGDNIDAPGIWDENLKRIQEKYKSVYGDAVSAYTTEIE